MDIFIIGDNMKDWVLGFLVGIFANFLFNIIWDVLVENQIVSVSKNYVIVFVFFIIALFYFYKLRNK